MRKEWEESVHIIKYQDKWEASDGIDCEVGKTPTQALEDLWSIAERRIEAEYREMIAEIKADEERGIWA
ncbi:MAG: hypothetical protein ACRCU6_08245 [Fusobacteriaceae bacterium]